MKITIIGSGLFGLSTAYHLLAEGHKVSIVERQPDTGLETSFANGGLLTPSLCDPWNAPGVLFNLLKYIGREDSPLLLRPKALPSLMFWGISFLRNSSQNRYNENIYRNTRLAKYNLAVLDDMTKKMPLSDLGGGKSTIKVCRHEEELDEVLKMAEFLAPENIPFKMLDRNQAFILEPSLKPLGNKVAGGIYFPEDRFGDAHQYCVELAQYLKSHGVEFIYNTKVTNMHTKGGRISHIDTDQGSLHADAFVLSAGSFSPLLASKVGVNIPVRPCKGYSLTLELSGWDNAPKIPVIDHSLHAAVTPLGNQIRVAGTAEFSGYDNELNKGRLQNLFNLLEGIFPESTPYITKEKTKEWTGLRPVSASGVPIIGQTKINNLYVNTGHGHLGWTCAAGSGKALADLISGKSPEINLSDYSLH